MVFFKCKGFFKCFKYASQKYWRHLKHVSVPRSVTEFTTSLGHLMPGRKCSQHNGTHQEGKSPLEGASRAKSDTV